MKEYISTIIYICIFSVILELILPDNKLKKYVGVLFSLVIILNILSPIVNLIESEAVEETISSTIDKLHDKIDVKEYNFQNISNKLIFPSEKENLENEIFTKCKKRFDSKYGVRKVDISLNENYTLENIDVYVNELPEVALAGEIIDYVVKEYNIQPSIINVIREE